PFSYISYVLSIALQLTGALVVLIMNFRVKRTSIIKSFNVKATIIVNGNTREVRDLRPAIRERFKISYTNGFAFLYLFGGDIF
ncbi:MAG: hypothetical protein LUC88_00190, partial [Prevotella sp.]|nr:hypothetical protein [Prevotella sp.]